MITKIIWREGQLTELSKYVFVAIVTIVPWQQNFYDNKNYLERRSINRIKQVCVCCHSNNCSKATKFFTSTDSLTASVNQTLSSEYL